MVATTIGISPWRSSGSAMPRLKPQPSTTTPTTQVTMKAIGSGNPNAENASIVNAGSITNSPCAKLMVPLACHSRVKPRAASA